MITRGSGVAACDRMFINGVEALAKQAHPDFSGMMVVVFENDGGIHRYQENVSAQECSYIGALCIRAATED